MKPAEEGARVLPLPLPLPRLLARQRQAELEFLPAALEIIETPPSPAGRAITFTIILFFAAAVAWASLGMVDIIATAQGRIVPTGRTKVVQPFETGVVRAIHVQDGQKVKAGEVLIELDPTLNGADRDRLQHELLAARLDVARLRAALAPTPNADTFAAPEGASPAQLDLQRRLLANQIEEYHAKLANIDRQLAQDEANRGAVAATVHKLVVSIPLLKQRVDARHYLADQGYGSKLDYLQNQQDLVEHEQDLEVQKARLTEAEATLAAAREQRRQADAEYRRTNLADLSQAEQKASSLTEELVKAQQHRDLQTLSAPVDGTVQQLAVHTVSGVVTPAQPLLVIVPAESHLEIEAMIENRDIGFVHPGEAAEVKIDTFNFTRYGLLRGQVVSVSQDAIAREKPGDKSGAAGGGSGNGAESDSSEPKGQELVYAARISLDRTQMQVEDRLVDLTPGMAVTAEIKTGSRRVIEYLLSPLLRYKHGSLRER